MAGSKTPTAPETAPSVPPRTLCIDIGGTGVKAMVVALDGLSLTPRARVPTPRPATPRALLAALTGLVKPLGAFERVSVGFPGVVIDGVTKTAVNLHPSWRDYPLQTTLASAFGRPVKVLNDAGVQGYGVVEGHGVEMLISLGTGMGCALFMDGRYVPNLELAHHPFRHRKTYEDLVGGAALKRDGKKRWNHQVGRVLAQIEPIWNPRRLYVGGGNAKHLTLTLPAHVTLTENVAGLLGGVALWREDAEAKPLGTATVTVKATSKKGAKRAHAERPSAPGVEE